MIHSRYLTSRVEYVLFSYPLHVCTCLIALLVLNSCQRDLTIELKTNDKRLLVDGEFTNDSIIHTINLYCSGSLITGKPQTAVTGAKIFLTDRVDTFYFAESVDTLGQYLTINRCCGKGGVTYYLSISNIDIDNDGVMDSFTSSCMMPVPVKFDSLVSRRGLNGDHEMAVNNFAYCKVNYHGPDYIFKFTLLNNYSDYGTITDRLGSGEINRFQREGIVPKVNYPDSVLCWRGYLSINTKVVEGDTISFICYNFTQEQFEFLKQFDNNANGDMFLDNMYDQLKIPANVSTNIEPASKAAGYFFVYSVSRKSHIFKE